MVVLWPFFGVRLAIFALKKQLVFSTLKKLSPVIAIDSLVRSVKKDVFLDPAAAEPVPI